MFHVIQDAFCVVRNGKGVFKQTKVYLRHGHLYINLSGGFVALRADGEVSTPNYSYDELVLPDGMVPVKATDRLGRLSVMKPAQEV